MPSPRALRRVAIPGRLSIPALVALCAFAQSEAAHAVTTTVADVAELRAAIDAANLAAGPDTILIAAPDPPAAGEPAAPRVLTFTGTVPGDVTYGDFALPPITDTLTIDGGDRDSAVLDGGFGLSLFLVKTSATVDTPAALTLRNITLQAGAGGGLTAGLVTVDAAPNTAGDVPALVIEYALLSTSRGELAGAVLNHGAPLSTLGVAFEDNQSDSGAGAVVTDTGGTFRGGAFRNNSGRVGALAAPQALLPAALGAVEATLSITSGTFEDNIGVDSGAVASAANLTVASSNFRRNRAEGGAGRGGAIFARNLTVNGTRFERNFAADAGAAIASMATPVSTQAAAISLCVFDTNTAEGTGAAVFLDTNANVTSSVFTFNRAGARGGALVFDHVTAGTVEDNVFLRNLARPIASLVVRDGAMDELGDAIGEVEVIARGVGAALLVDTSTGVSAHGNCFLGNNGFAVSAPGSTAMNASGNWWGSTSGAGTNGAGDSADVGPTLSVTSPLSAAPAICVDDGAPIYNETRVSAFTDNVATPPDDYIVYRADSGGSVLTSPVGAFYVDERTGILALEVHGVNDALEEGDERVRLNINGCTGSLAACPYYQTATSGPAWVELNLEDNGDGVVAEGEGEGEGEGEECAHFVVSPSSLTLAAGESGTIVVGNDGSCELVLNSPLLSSGASLGFALEGVPQSALRLDTAATVELVVSYNPPVDDGSDTGEFSNGEDPAAPTGTLVIRSTVGQREEIALAAAPTCTCSASPHGRGSVPRAALVTMLLPLCLRRRRR